MSRGSSSAACNNDNQERKTMSIAKVSEITSASSESFEDAVRKGIKRFGKTVDNVQGAWIKEQKVVVEDGKISEYRVTMAVTFVLKDKD